MNNIMSVKEMLGILRRRWKLLVIVPVVCAIAGCLISIYALTPEYQAQSDLLVNQTHAGDDGGASTTNVDMNLRLIDTYQTIIESPSVIKKVNRELGGKETLTDIKENLNVRSNSSNQIITLYARATDPQSASHLVNTYARAAQEEIANLMNMNNVRIMTGANADEANNQVSPHPLINTLASFLGGFVLILIYIGLSVYFNTKVYSGDDVEKYLDVPVLSSIGMLHKRKQNGRHEIYNADFPTMPIQGEVDRAKLEAFRHLRVNIQFQVSVKNLNSLLVTSTEIDEGKTTTAENLAISMAMDNKKTLLINADLRKPSRFSFEERDGKVGLTHYLSGQRDSENAIQQLDMPNLYVMSNGPLPPNPTELLASLRMDKLLLDLEKEFDMVILDTSPMIFSDAAVLAAKVDGCVFINKAGKTKVTHAQRAMNQLKRADATVLGVVLNHKKEKITQYDYRYNV